MRFFQDLFGIYRKYRWGYVMWNFKGPFGIIEHGRTGAKFEPYHGFNVDRALFELYLEHRV
jgi:endoglucanase